MQKLCRNFYERDTVKEIAQPYASYLSHLPERKGKYHFFVNMVCDDGSHVSQEGQSIVVREDYASNLYMHMAENIVERLIFHNPVVNEINRVHLELATRVVKVKGPDKDKKSKEYRRLGYIEDKTKNIIGMEKLTFFLTTGVITGQQLTEKCRIPKNGILSLMQS